MLFPPLMPSLPIFMGVGGIRLVVRQRYAALQSRERNHIYFVGIAQIETAIRRDHANPIGPIDFLWLGR
ncbi:hypothetical protein ACVOMT_08230 [Sphingomonas panni]